MLRQISPCEGAAQEGEGTKGEGQHTDFRQSGGGGESEPQLMMGGRIAMGLHRRGFGFECGPGRGRLRRWPAGFHASSRAASLTGGLLRSTLYMTGTKNSVVNGRRG